MAAPRPTIALARLLEGGGQVFPVTHIRRKDGAKCGTSFPAIHEISVWRGVFPTSTRGDVIHLRFVDQTTGWKNKRLYAADTPGGHRALIDCDAFVCVPISDYEVPLER